MINKYTYLFAAFLVFNLVFSQTTETFETETDNSVSFTDNSLVFNITSQAGGTFDIANFPGTGWNGTAIDNKYIDNTGSADIGIPVQFTIKSAGGTSFRLKSIYLFLSQSDLNPGSGSCTITGKKSGLTIFTATSSTGFNNPTNFGTNNGFTFIDLTSYGGSNNSNANIDEFVITTTGTFEYVALDAMKWEYDCSALVAPTASAQNFCDSANVSNLVATGNSLKWYAASSGGSPLAGTTALTTKTYYVTSNSTFCESARIPVSVTITPSSDNVTTVTACDSYTWNGTTYTTSGIKTGPTVNCVTEKLNLTITPSSDNVTTITACDSYTWNGTTYTTSGIKTGPTVNCVTEKLDLTITPSSDNVTTITACDSYTWNGTTYTTSGIKTGPTVNCVTEKLDLTINTSPVATVSIVGLLGNSSELIADQSGATYQWIDCNNSNTPISGENNQNFFPMTSGTFSVIVTLGNCSVTSDCIVVSNLKIDSFDLNSFKFYPNPVKNNLNISYSKEITSAKVINMIGQTISEKLLNSKEAQIEMSNLPSGTYFLDVKSADSSKTFKIIKE